MGVIRNVNVKISKKGDKFAFVRLEDRTGEIELLIFSKAYSEYFPLLINENVIAVNGKISAGDEEAPKLIVSVIAPMKANGKYVKGPSPFASLTQKGTKASRQGTPQNQSNTHLIAPVTAQTQQSEDKRRLFLRVRSIDSDEVKNAISVISATKGNVPVIFYDSQTSKYVSRADLKLDPSDRAIAMLKRLLGEENVVMKG